MEEKNEQKKENNDMQKNDGDKIFKNEKINEQKDENNNINAKEEQKNEENLDLIKNLRTYRDDVAEILGSQKTSLTKMVLSEQKKREKNGFIIEEKRNLKINGKLLTSILIVFLLLIGSGSAYFYITNKNSRSIEITELKIPTFIFPNYQRELFFKNLKKTTLIDTIKNEEVEVSIPLGSVIHFFLTSDDKTNSFIVEQTKGNKLLVTTKVFLDSLDSKAPSSLTRALDPDFMFGYHSSLGNNPFIILRVKSYENAFAGMLDWEKTIIKELLPIFERENSKIDINNYNFKDIIIANKDVRAILNNEGKIEFAYSFFDKENLVIVNNETTLKEIYRRLTTAKLEKTN